MVVDKETLIEHGIDYEEYKSGDYSFKYEGFFHYIVVNGEKKDLFENYNITSFYEYPEYNKIIGFNKDITQNKQTVLGFYLNPFSDSDNIIGEWLIFDKEGNVYFEGEGISHIDNIINLLN